MTKRGINLGCGRMIMPREKAAHHALLPDELYTDGIQWDNVDSVEQDGVSHVVDLFDYPWMTRGKTWYDVKPLPDDVYDVALVSHLCEHIPHGVKRHGQVVGTHGGWFAWWAELGRVLKPGGVAYVLSPHAYSRGAVIDPTHTRYLIPETFGYFAPDDNAPFQYSIGYQWKAVYGPITGFSQLALQHTNPDTGAFDANGWEHALTHLDMRVEFAIGLEVIKHAG